MNTKLHKDLIADFIDIFEKYKDELSPYADRTFELCQSWFDDKLSETVVIISECYECDASHITRDINILNRHISDERLKRKLEALVQLIELEVVRFSAMSRLLHVNNLPELYEIIENIKIKLFSLQDQQQNMTTHYITILGIFAAIVLGATSVTSMSKTMLELVGSSDMQRCTLFYAIYTMFCLDVIYFLVKAISRNKLANRIVTLSNIVVLLVNIGLVILIIKLCV